MDPHKDAAPTCRPPRLLDQARDKLRTLHYRYRTEQQYLQWVRRFILFHDKRHPRTMGAPEVEAFLTHLAVTRKVSAATQNQALAALLFLYQNVLELELPWLKDVVRAKPSRRLPVVMTHKEVRAVLAELEDEYWLIGSILYGGGLRLQEALQLRVKDVDFDLRQLIVRSGKGNKDRVTILPEVTVEPLQRHLDVVRAQHAQAMKRGHGGVELPFTLECKYPAAPFERPATFAASLLDLAGGLGLRATSLRDVVRALRRCAPRWGPRFVVLVPTHQRMKRPADWRAHSFLAGGLGFEPRLTESESVVLPLDDPPKEPLRGSLQAAP